MMNLAIDLSNHNGPLSYAVAQCLIEQGVGVGVQAIDPPEPYPPTQTRQQLTVLRDVGYRAPLLDGYVWLFPHEESMDLLNRRLDLLDGFLIDDIWLDIEDDDLWNYDAARNIDLAFRALDVITTRGYGRGIYTARYVINGPFAGTAAFAGERLWAVGNKYGSGYGPQPESLDLVQPFGGWLRAEGIQFTSTGSLCGFTGDMSVFEYQEADVTEKQKAWILALANAQVIVAKGGDIRDLAPEDGTGLKELSDAFQRGY